MTGQQIALVVGGATELVGVALASLDIWFDAARTSARNLSKRSRHLASRSWRWVQRKILRQTRVKAVSASASLPFEFEGSASSRSTRWRSLAIVASTRSMCAGISGSWAPRWTSTSRGRRGSPFRLYRSHVFGHPLVGITDGMATTLLFDRDKSEEVGAGYFWVGLIPQRQR